MADEIKVTARIDPQLAGAINDLSSQMERLTAVIEDGTKRTVEEIHKVAESAAKTELAKERAELKAVSPLLREQNTQIEVQRQKTVNGLIEIQRKFDKIAQELWQSYIRDIRRLGAHIFEIVEQEYKRGMERRVVEAEYDIFTGITKKVYEKNSGNLAGWMEKTRDAARQFINMRQQFKATLTERKLDTTVPSGQEFAVPVWLVKIQDNLGNVSWKVIGLSKLNKVEEGEYKCNYTENSSYAEVKDKVQSNIDSIVNSLNWQNTTEAEKKAIEGKLDELAAAKIISGDLKRIISRSFEGEIPTLN